MGIHQSGYPAYTDSNLEAKENFKNAKKSAEKDWMNTTHSRNQSKFRNKNKNNHTYIYVRICMGL
jgi:hypothetical protein